MNINEQYNDAYKDAHRIDRLLNRLLIKHPIEHNPYYWIKLCRTIITGLATPTEMAEEQVKKLENLPQP